MPADSQVRKEGKSIIDNVEKHRLYRGKGGEIMRAGVSHLIYSMSLAGISFTIKE